MARVGTGDGVDRKGTNGRDGGIVSLVGGKSGHGGSQG